VVFALDFLQSVAMASREFRLAAMIDHAELDHRRRLADRQRLGKRIARHRAAPPLHHLTTSYRASGARSNEIEFVNAASAIEDTTTLHAFGLLSFVKID
jgi:hypothetical protein